MKATSIGLLSLLFTFSSLAVFSQNAKKLIKEAEKDIELKKFSDAIPKLNEALKLEPDNLDALTLRAKSLKSNNQYNDALADFQKIAVLKPKNASNYYEIADVQFLMEDFKSASETFDKVIESNPKLSDAYRKKAFCKYKLKEFGLMLNVASQGVKTNKDDEWSTYYMAVAYDSLGNKPLAEQFYQKAIDIVKEDKRKALNQQAYGSMYFGLGNIQNEFFKFDQALATFNTLIKIDPSNAEAFRRRGMVYLNKQDYQNALNDLNQSIALSGKNFKAFVTRAEIYSKLGQFQASINDYGQSLMLEPQCIECICGRAESYFQSGNYKESANDYKAAMKLAPGNAELQKKYTQARDKYYENNKESIAPVVRIINSKGIETEELTVREDAKKLKFKIQVNDQSPIKSVVVGAKPLDVDPEVLNPEFDVEIAISDIKSLEIIVSDIYLNQTKKSYLINRTEIEAPVITLVSPYPAENQVFIESKPNLYVEGKIKDRSKIKSIYINDAYASFSPDAENPVFTANIAIGTKDSLIIRAIDINENESIARFKIVREDTTGANPMGLTWVIFIENSDYQNLQKLEGPPRDIRDLKSSLNNYQVDKFIHKPNMTKEQLDKFFRIELRDMVQKSRVKSLMIWYAGHGKFLNETGYWIPVDGDSYDEYSYYSINVLRSALQSYTALKHILVISDACESGPAFYMAMRDDELKGRTCSSWEPTKFKSAQVFTSSNKEKSSDNSLFTQAFIHTLQNNNQSCISIESIAEKVSGVVKQNLKQSPKFGKIKGLDDEDGSFFFLKKE
jgi:tetratricopeptide (TPR) repeat protein